MKHSYITNVWLTDWLLETKWNGEKFCFVKITPLANQGNCSQGNKFLVSQNHKNLVNFNFILLSNNAKVKIAVRFHEINVVLYYNSFCKDILIPNQICWRSLLGLFNSKWFWAYFNQQCIFVRLTNHFFPYKRVTKT
jgi:hypothetical protein